MEDPNVTLVFSRCENNKEEDSIMKKKPILFSITYCVFVALLPAQHVYYVSPTGDDSNPGTITEPWRTWQKAVYVSVPGDTTYIRGGIYKPTNYIGYFSAIGMSIIPGDGVGVSGTAEAPICYFNYPGESPVLDGSLMTTNVYGWLGGIDIQQAEYIHLRGLTVCHIHQSPPDFSREQKPYSEVYGIGSSGANIRYENMVSHDIDGRGFAHWSYAWNEFDCPDAPFKSDSTIWINCDAYNLYDRYAQEPGNAADGWKVHGYYGNHYYWEGCRAWNYSDDGFDPSGQAYRTFKNCWAMSTDKYEGLSDDWNIEGNGFKMTGVGIKYFPNYVVGEKRLVRVENCIAANCVGVGFYNNILVNYDDQWPNGGILYNNFAYKNNIGFSDADSSILRNNIVYDSQDAGPVGEKYEISAYHAWYTESNNTWIANDPSPGSWPWWKYNPAFNVTDDDFVSLDYLQLTAPRKADGSLPDITFGHLRKDSELIDAGVDVGLPFSGAAPDVGAFEYYSSAVTTNNELPGEYQLFQNYPNPFNPNTIIAYHLPSTNHVTLKVFDVLGKEVTTLINEVRQPGDKLVKFDASALASGVYFYRLQAGSFTKTKKLLLLK
jgi:hypothetical protein